MNAPVRSMVPAENFHAEEIAPGVTMRRLYPGGRMGPNNEVAKLERQKAVSLKAKVDQLK
mgnify:CR=1 FL=1